MGFDECQSKLCELRTGLGDRIRPSIGTDIYLCRFIRLALLILLRDVVSLTMLERFVNDMNITQTWGIVIHSVFG